MDSGSTPSGGGRGRSPDIGPANVRNDESDDGDDQSVSEDDLFAVLSNRRRRRVVAYLLEGDGTATAGELAEHIAAEENDTTVEQLSTYQRKRVYVSLYQNHLPMLDDANVVDYNHNRKTVTLEVAGGTLQPLVGERLDPVTHLAVIGAAVVLAIGVLLGSLQVGVFAAAPVWTWIAIGSVGLLGLAGLERRGH